MALDDATLKRIAAIQAAANHVAGLSGTVEDVIITADIFLQYIEDGGTASPAQAIANQAFSCTDKEKFAELWRQAAKQSLMQHEVTLGTMTGSLGDYMEFKAGEFKTPGV